MLTKRVNQSEIRGMRTKQCLGADLRPRGPTSATEGFRGRPGVISSVSPHSSSLSFVHTLDLILQDGKSGIIRRQGPVRPRVSRVAGVLERAPDQARYSQTPAQALGDLGKQHLRPSAHSPVPPHARAHQLDQLSVRPRTSRALGSRPGRLSNSEVRLNSYQRHFRERRGGLDGFES